MARTSTKTSTPETEAPPHIEQGQVGEYLFQRVQTLTENGAMSRQAAFEQVAQETGRKTGTVMANYYRVARKHGVVQKRVRVSDQMAAVEDSEIDELLTAILDSATRLAQVAKARGKRIEKLESQMEKLDEVRRLFAN